MTYFVNWFPSLPLETLEETRDEALTSASWHGGAAASINNKAWLKIIMVIISSFNDEIITMIIIL